MEMFFTNYNLKTTSQSIKEEQKIAEIEHDKREQSKLHIRWKINQTKR
jgi:hypothetical protein